MTVPTAPPLTPSAGYGTSSGQHRRRRSSANINDSSGDGGGNNRRRRPSSSAAQGDTAAAAASGSDERRRRNGTTGNHSNIGSSNHSSSTRPGEQARSSKRKTKNRRPPPPPAELAMLMSLSAADQPLPPPPPVDQTSTTRRSSSVTANQIQQQQSQSSRTKKKKRSSQTETAETAATGTEGSGPAPSQSRRNSQSRSQSQSRSSSRPPAVPARRSSSAVRESTNTSTAASSTNGTAANKDGTSSVAKVASDIQAEITRRQSRLDEMRQRSDAQLYEGQILEEAKRIRRLQKEVMKLQQAAAQQEQEKERGSGAMARSSSTRSNDASLNDEEAIPVVAIRRSSSAVSSGTGTGKNDNTAQSNNRQSQKRRKSSITAGNVPPTANGNVGTEQQRGGTSRRATVGALPLPQATAIPINGNSGGTTTAMRSSMASDEALARAMHAEMLREQEAVRAMEQQFQDEEMARSLAAAEAARMTSLGLSPTDFGGEGAGSGGGGGSRGRPSRGGGGCCNTVNRMISFVIMAGCVGVVLFVLFGIVYRSAGGDVEALPPWFRDSWGQGWEGDYGGPMGEANASDFQLWRTGGREKKGLKLTLINALSEDWNGHFYQAIEDWNQASALDLSTVPDNTGPPCEKHSRGMVKVCNGDYGRTDWTGLNELLFENNFIVSSVAMMNEAYLRNSRDSERQYVICHELGHAWGLPHRDEVVGNRDLGTCLDYTITPSNNMKPDDIDYENLKEMYGEAGAGSRRLRSMEPGDDDEGDSDVLLVSSYASNTTNVGATARGKKPRRRVLLHQSQHSEIWHEDLGNGRSLVTQVLLSSDETE